MTSLTSQEILTSFDRNMEMDNTTFSIFLEHFIVTDDTIEMEPGAPYLFDGNGDRYLKHHMCIFIH